LDTESKLFTATPEVHLMSSTYGLSKDLGLEKKDYSVASSMTSIATLAWQPFSAYLIVRVNPRILMTVNVFCWGTAAACMAAANGNASLLVTRFLLGLFEAANIPLCSYNGELQVEVLLTISLDVDRHLVPTS